MKVGRTVQSRAQGTKKFLVPLIDAGQGRSGYAEGMPSQLGHRQPRGSQLFVEAPLHIPVPEEGGVSHPAPQLNPEIDVGPVVPQRLDRSGWGHQPGAERRQRVGALQKSMVEQQ